jgi:hypothetical protein
MVVWSVTQPPEGYDVTVVSSQDETPIPNHLASADPAPEQPKEKPKRRLFAPPPPKQNSGTKDFKPPKDMRPVPPIPPGPRGFAPGIEKMYGSLALAAMAFDVELAATIMKIAPDAADAWNELAKRNIQVRRIIVALMETTAWGAVLAAHLPIFLLFIKRVAGNDPRFSALGQMLGEQAEEHANNPENGTAA